MSSHNTNHYSHIPASVYNFTDVVGISILNVDEKITEKNTILDLIREFNRKKEEESLQKKTEEKSKS